VGVIEQPKEWKPLPKKFADAIRVVRHCASSDESSFLLTCVHIHPEFVEACDSLQMARYPLKMGIKEPLLVKRDSIKHIVGMRFNEFSETEVWVHFRNKAGLVMSCRRYVEKFMDLDWILDLKGEEVKFPTRIEEIVGRAQVFSSDGSRDELVQVSLKPGRMKLEGRGRHGWYKEVKKVEYDGGEMDFKIFPKLLVEISKQSGKCLVGKGKMKVEGEDFIYVSSTVEPG
jgi:hypothetical protein